MIRSHNEIAAMATKAARGAGIPLGHAEDFGPIVAHIAVHNPSALACLEAVLNSPQRPIAMQSDTSCILISAAQVIFAAPTSLDLIKAGAKRVELLDPDAPALLEAYCDASGITACARSGAVYTITHSTEDFVADPIQAADFPEDIWKILSEFAARTYVPASEASRLSGAGAGLHDND